MPSGCPRFRKRSWHARWASRFSLCRVSATWPPAFCPGCSITPRSSTRRAARAGRFPRCWRESLDSSDQNRLSVTLVDVAPGRDAEFAALAEQLRALLVRKRYGISELVRDEAHPLRYYSVRRWTDAAAAAACHADPEGER